MLELRHYCPGNQTSCVKSGNFISLKPLCLSALARLILGKQIFTNICIYKHGTHLSGRQLGNLSVYRVMTCVFPEFDRFEGMWLLI